MVEAQKSADIGMRRGQILSNLSQRQQLDLIAEGLPILVKSAGELLTASKSLGNHHRAATILTGHALEEVAKALILVDIVRCPPKLRGKRIGPMMRWFYNHLARLIYLDAQDWKPTDVNELQRYVDNHRKSHYLEGEIGEYILPNHTTWSRESVLYADIITYEDGEPMWQSPDPTYVYYDTNPWELCQALSNMGIFDRRGLDIVSIVWAQVDFDGPQNWQSARRLTHEMLVQLENANLISDNAQEQQLSLLYNLWQLPMYRIDFNYMEVDIKDLRDEQEANLSVYYS